MVTKKLEIKIENCTVLSYHQVKSFIILSTDSKCQLSVKLQFFFLEEIYLHFISKHGIFRHSKSASVSYKLPTISKYSFISTMLH